MTHLGTLRTSATLENLHLLTDFVHSIGHHLGLDDRTLFHLDLAVEEAAANVVQHAYPEGPPSPVELRAELDQDAVRLTLSDWGKPFDPRQALPFDIHAPIESRIRGGMGLHFIHSLMDQVTRHISQSPGAPNTLTLVKRIDRARPAVAEESVQRASSQRELDAILSVSRSISADVAQDDLLALIINELVRAVQAERGAIYLIDGKRRELVSRVLSEDSAGLTEIRLQIGQGLAGHVAATGKGLNVPDAYADPRFNPEVDRQTGRKTHSILTMPMRNPHGTIVGVVQVLNKDDGPFTERDERLLAAMATQAAISIENARLSAQEMQQRLVLQELATARSIQQGFLPQSLPHCEGWEIAAHWHPMREVAGDFYDLYTLPDGRLALVIADVSGKGVPAALFMALSVTVLRFAMYLDFSPAELLLRANQAILANQGSRMFTTAFVGYLDLETGELCYASAGHNPPLLYRKGARECEYLAAPGVAMGLFENAAYAERRTTLYPGDLLALYTDGITEAIDANEREFGPERLEALVLQQADCPASDLAERILHAAADFGQAVGITDDETLLVVKRVPALHVE
jgi:serine phosphatase RsbU (regulator of sigma subunit)/anti-sigma regulatory factor (Ser/Thr protein kinase)